MSEPIEPHPRAPIGLPWPVRFTKALAMTNLLQRWARRIRPTRTPEDPWSLDHRLLRWSGRDAHTTRDAVGGVLVLGATGSGKTSGPGETLLKSYLRAGFGCVIHTVKPQDVDTAVRWAGECGRADDVVLFGPGHARLNFLNYALNRPGAGAGLSDNVANLLLTASEIEDRRSGGGSGGGGGDNQFFKVFARKALRASIDVEAAATGQVSVPGIHGLVTSAPTSLAQFHAKEWREQSYLFRCLQEATRRAREVDGKMIGGVFRSDLENAGKLWCDEWPQMADRTRSSVLSSVTGVLDTLNRGFCKEILCTDTTFVPEDLFAGKILIHTMSTMEYGSVGEMVQVVTKLVVQGAIEVRDVRVHPRPVGFYIDEYQRLATSADAKFAATCRSARGALLLLTQTLPSIYSALGGGDLAKQETASLFGNLNTKVLCANTDPDTTEWASNLVGKTRQFMINASRQRDAMQGRFGRGPGSAGVQEVMEAEIQPTEFAKLRTGGPAHRRCVDAIVYRTNEFHSTRRNWMRTTFKQQG